VIRAEIGLASEEVSYMASDVELKDSRAFPKLTRLVAGGVIAEGAAYQHGV